MIFVRYKDRSKGYVFWDAAHQCFKISPAKEMILAQPAPLSNHQLPESDNESDSSGLDLVKLAQPPMSPGQSAPSQPVMSPPAAPPAAPPPVPWRMSALPDVETAPLLPPTPQYLLCPTKQHLA